MFHDFLVALISTTCHLSVILIQTELDIHEIRRIAVDEVRDGRNSLAVTRDLFLVRYLFDEGEQRGWI